MRNPKQVLAPAWQSPCSGNQAESVASARKGAATVAKNKVSATQKKDPRTKTGKQMRNLTEQYQRATNAKLPMHHRLL